MKKIFKFLLSLVFTYCAKRKCKYFGLNSKVNFYSRFTKNTFIGESCHFNGIKIYGDGDVHIGNHCHCGKKVTIFTSNHNYDGGKKLPYDETNIVEPVTIEDNVWIGEHVYILPGVTIGEGSVIQVESVVVSNIPKYSVAGGHPARVFKKRDKDHYDKLYLEGKFKE